MATPELWIVAGPNGAGKTTLVQSEPISLLLPGVRFLNADDLTLEKLRTAGFAGFEDAPLEAQREAFVESADDVMDDLERAIANGERTGVESVLSTPKYRPIVESVVAASGSFRLIYITLSSPTLAVERVAKRFRRGGHSVPAEKIVARWTKSLEQLPWFANHAENFWVFDNSSSDAAEPPELVATGAFGEVTHRTDCFSELDSALDKLGAQD